MKNTLSLILACVLMSACGKENSESSGGGGNASTQPPAPTELCPKPFSVPNEPLPATGIVTNGSNQTFRLIEVRAWAKVTLSNGKKLYGDTRVRLNANTPINNPQTTKEVLCKDFREAQDGAITLSARYPLDLNRSTGGISRDLLATSDLYGNPSHPDSLYATAVNPTGNTVQAYLQLLSQDQIHYGTHFAFELGTDSSGNSTLTISSEFGNSSVQMLTRAVYQVVANP